MVRRHAALASGWRGYQTSVTLRRRDSAPPAIGVVWRINVHPEVQQTIHAIIRDSRLRPRRALEVGGVMGPNSLLRCSELEGAERYCLNLVAMRSRAGIKAVAGNANDMRVFEDETFELIMSNATLEHDKHFWLSLAEMRRVLAPGGLLILGAPGYAKNPEHDHGKSTHTYRVHYRFDYYRFSEQAFRDVFFEGMEDVEVRAILAPPRIIGLGFRAGGDRSAADRQAAARALTGAPSTATSQRVARRAVRQRRPHTRFRRLLDRLRARRA
jgi:SAM-dependent methyltransferase